MVRWLQDPTEGAVHPCRHPPSWECPTILYKNSLSFKVVHTKNYHLYPTSLGFSLDLTSFSMIDLNPLKPGKISSPFSSFPPLKPHRKLLISLLELGQCNYSCQNVNSIMNLNILQIYIYKIYICYKFGIYSTKDQFSHYLCNNIYFFKKLTK